MSDSELKAAKIKEAVKKELDTKNEIVELKRTNNYRCVLCCLFPFRSCMDSSVLPDARGGFISGNSKPVRRRSIPAPESDPATEELIRRVWHDQDEDEIQVDDSIKDESASESSSHDNISIVKDIDQLTHTCNEVENDDSIQVENIHDGQNLQESENVDNEEQESNVDITESSIVTTTVAIVTEHSEQDIEEEEVSNTSEANSSNVTETSQEDSNTDVASSFDGSFDGNNAVASLNNSHEEGSTTTDYSSTTNSSDDVSRDSSDVISNDDVIESSNDVTDAGLHRNVVKKESSKPNKEYNSLPRKNKRSLISRLTKPSKSASKSEETDELNKSSKKILTRKGSFREKLQKKLFEEKSKKSSSSSIESSASPTKLSPSRAVVTPTKAANKKSTFKSTKGIKKLGLLVGKQIFVASGAGKKEYKLVNAFSPPAVQASSFCVGLPMVRTPSKRRTVPHHAIGTVSNVLYMKRTQH